MARTKKTSGRLERTKAGRMVFLLHWLQTIVGSEEEGPHSRNDAMLLAAMLGGVA